MSTASTHRHGIDLARFLAAFGVVYAHSEASPHDWSGHLSLALFAVLTAFLAVKSAMRAGGSYAYLPRAKRLILPWVLWSLFYWVLDYAVTDGPYTFPPLSNPWSLLYGGGIHLWFLPFIGLAMVLVSPAVAFVTSPGRLAGMAALMVALSAPLFWAHGALELPMPVAQWTFTLPCYVLGLLLARADAMGRRAVVLAAGAALSAMAVWMGQAEPWTFTVIVGLAGFELFWRLPLRGAFVQQLGQVAFGIYLIHPFLMLVLYKLEGPQIPVLSGAVQDFLLSWAVVALLRRIPAFARIT